MSKATGFKKIEVTGIAMYANVHTPKKAYTEGESPLYSLDLIVDEDNAKILLAEGLKPAKVLVDEDTKKYKEYDNYPGQRVFNFKRKVQKQDGTTRTAPAVVDSNLNKIPSDVLIGNGSRVRVSINPYIMNIKGKEITGSVLLGVQVLELSPYTKDDTGGFTKTEGYTVNTQTSEQNPKLGLKQVPRLSVSLTSDTNEPEPF